VAAFRSSVAVQQWTCCFKVLRRTESHLDVARAHEIHHNVGAMMTRTQLSFEREMLRRARARAGELGVSLAEYVRRLVAEDLEESVAVADPAVVFDLGRSGGSDIAKDKDAMLGEVMERAGR
jgi:hypothetical protein